MKDRNPGGTRAFFAYGTLMCADIFERVTQCRLPGEPAVLYEYGRYPMRGQFYPGILPHTGVLVRGLLYLGLPARSWARLDLFEGEMYCRTPVAVCSQQGWWWRAQTYVVRPAFAALLSLEDWSLEEFLRWGKPQFAAAYRGFDDLSGAET